MTVIGWIILLSLVAGVGSALVASVFLLLSPGHRERLLPHLVSFAIGAQLGAAFLGLLPHALEERGVSPRAIGLTIVLGLMAFFVLEKLIRWHHHDDPEQRTGLPSSALGRLTAARLILVGDGLHNLIHGFLIGAAFLTDVHLGIVITVAVLAHEIPQEIGDVAILVAGGFSRGTAFLLNLTLGLTTLAGALIAWFALGHAQMLLPYVLSIAVANLTYVAAADLIPGLHQSAGARAGAGQVLLMALGVFLILAAQLLTRGA